MNARIGSSRFPIILLLTLLSVGCAENVGGRMPVVKIDMQLIQQKLAVNPIGQPNSLAKASSVSITSRFTGAEAQKVIAGIEMVANSMGYQKNFNESQSDGEYILFCHGIEAGRSINIIKSLNEATVSVGVSGWSDDRENCSGNRGRK